MAAKKKVTGRNPKGAGRKKGSRNKRTLQQEKAIRDSGLTPLEYLTKLYRNPRKSESVRIDAAKAAAPYVHAKLSSVEMTANVNMTHEQALDELD